MSLLGRKAGGGSVCPSLAAKDCRAVHLNNGFQPPAAKIVPGGSTLFGRGWKMSRVYLCMAVTAFVSAMAGGTLAVAAMPSAHERRRDRL